MTNVTQVMQGRELPLELWAVLLIFNADDELRTKALPFVNIERQTIDWDRISSHYFGSGHSAAVLWAKAIWLDQMPPKSDPFDRAFSMDNRLRFVVLKALGIRWGLGR